VPVASGSLDPGDYIPRHMAESSDATRQAHSPPWEYSLLLLPTVALANLKVDSVGETKVETETVTWW
jgi:hypothetical protein